MNNEIFWIVLGLVFSVVSAFTGYRIGRCLSEEDWEERCFLRASQARREEREIFERVAINAGVAEYNQIDGRFMLRKPSDIAIDFIERACEEKE